MTALAETAYIALAALLQNVQGLGLVNGEPNVSRIYKDIGNIDAGTMPALLINETGEEIITSKGFEGLNAKQILNCDLYLYVNQTNVEDIPSTQINTLNQAVRAALAPTAPDVFQTLNGLVSHCWVSGKIIIIEGILNGQGIAIIPVNILTTC